MKSTERGVTEQSQIFFYTPSPFGKKVLFYPQAIGEFFCGTEYHLKRSNYDSILLLYVAEGTLTLRLTEKMTASAGEMLVIDCAEPHEYYTESHARTQWIHFNGNGAREWMRELVQARGCCIACPEEVPERMERVLSLVKEEEKSMKKNETSISAEIYGIMCALSSPERPGREDGRRQQVEKAERYMAEHLDRNLSVQEIADAVSMSSSHFTKVFREATGIAPYDCLLNIRLERAKDLLRRTDLSVSEVAYRCGFNSDANFISFFRKRTDVTPLKFRNLQF